MRASGASDDPCEALANTAQCINWPRHFGLPSRLDSAIKNVLDRYVITTFA